MARPLSPYAVCSDLTKVSDLIKEAGRLLDRLAATAPDQWARIEAVRGVPEIDMYLARRIADCATAIERDEDERLARLEAESAEYERQMSASELDQLVRRMPTHELKQAMAPAEYATAFQAVR